MAESPRSRCPFPSPALPLVVLAATLATLAPPPAAAGAQTPNAREASSPQDPADAPPGAPVDPVVTPAAGTPGHEELAPVARAVPLEGEIQLDGRLEEAVWETAPPVTRFVQRDPDEGEAASQATEVRFTYDGESLYVGARMYDEGGQDGVTSRLARRDSDAQSDELRIIFDTFLDHVGQTVFAVNPAGVRRDAFGPGGASPDPNWDPVWRARARADSLGWSVELAIPFSQLRFARGENQRWGLQIERTVQRLNEEQRWSYWPRNEQGGPSRFGHLEGIEAPREGTDRLELMPYAVSTVDVRESGGGADPFRGALEGGYRLGADARYLLNSNLTLNATVNPDFGQAEVDPAVVNLSAFETFFPEKREFFIEGRGLFSFGNFWCKFCSNTSSLGMLFTRRIGRAPVGAGLARAAGDFADVPDQTTILGAAKVTGRLGTGTSVGILNALTDRESAAVTGADGSRFRQEVEPLANYFVGRAKQDLLDGDLQVGGIVTSVVRDFEDPALAGLMNAHSEGVGLDAEYWWGDRTYHLLFSGAATNISGSPEAILRAQTSSARYLQRPDRKGDGNGLFTNRFDSTLTSMRGYGLYARVAKDAGDWQGEGALNVRSPGFENNDIAFLTRTDFVWMNANLQRSWTTPGSWYRRVSTTVGAQQQFNFDGDLTDRQLHASFFTQTPFWWNVNAFGIYRPSTLDDRLTRGGPVVRKPESFFGRAFVNTDSRKPWIVGFSPSYGWDEEGGYNWNLGLDFTLKPRSNLLVSLGPSLGRSLNPDQYVTAVDDPTAEAFFGRRYVFADLEQTSLSMTTRLNVTFTPDMTLELFLQPLISANDFSRFKEFAAPRTLEKVVFGEERGTIRTEGEGAGRLHFVDPDGPGPAEEFSFSDRDFNFRSLRGNLVFRWEYLPGSTLFLVWTQDRSSVRPFGDFSLARDADALLGGDGEHVFLLKLTYWLGV